MLNAGGAGREHLDGVTQFFGNNCPLGHDFISGLD
jgi:hypothetical protein